MLEMKTFNGYEIVDKKARTEIEALKEIPISKGEGENAIKLGSTNITETQLQMLLASLRYDISGAWTLKGHFDRAIKEEVSFNCNGCLCNGIQTNYNEDEGGFLMYYYYSDDDYWQQVYSAEISWLGNYETIAFIGTQKVSAEFLQFMQKNAVRAVTVVIDCDGGPIYVGVPKGTTFGELLTKYNCDKYFTGGYYSNDIEGFDGGNYNPDYILKDGDQFYTVY